MAFQFTPYSSPLTASIADRLAQQGAIEAQRAYATGNAAANAALQSGNAWSGAIQGVGQAIGALPGQIQALKASEQNQAIRNQQLQAGALQLAQGQRTEQTAQLVDQYKARVAELASDPTLHNEDGTLNADALAGHLSTLPGGAAGPTPPVDREALAKVLTPINQDVTAARDAKLKWDETKTNALARIAGSAYTLGSKDGNYAPYVQLGMATALKNGLITQADANAVLVPMVEHPETVPTLLQSLAARSTLPPIKLGKEDTLVSALNPSQVLARGAEAPPTEAELAVKAAGGDPTATKAMTLLKPAPPGKGKQSESFLLDGKPVKGVFDPESGTYTYNGEDVTGRVRPIPAASTIINPAAATDVKDAVAGMKDGTLPPQLPGRASKEYLALMAEARRQGFDLAGAATDWTATQKHIASLNGAQQLRLNQSINALPDMLDSVDSLATKWNAGSFPVLNKANLALAKNGVYGKDAATIANQLDAQIADVTADLGNVYMGGNSPTDHALGLASKSLSADWDATVLHNMVDLARKNVTIRQNSMRNTGVAGASATNPYAPPAAAPPAAAPPDQAVQLKAQQVLAGAGKASDPAAVAVFLKNNPGFK